MIQDHAFDVLGISPTTDRAAIRRAYVRLARIYHPDRYAEEPDDVRAEAERRMKQVAAAYSVVRNPETPVAPAPSERVVRNAMDEARRFRDEIAARRRQNLERHVRHERWDELEAQARQRADEQARYSVIMGGTFQASGSVARSAPAARAGTRRRSALEIRLEAARKQQGAAAGDLAIRHED